MESNRTTVTVVAGGVLLAAGLLGLAYWTNPGGFSSGNAPAVTNASDEKLARGRRLYRRHCQTCHGKTGRSKGPAADYLTRTPLNFHSDTAASYSDEELFRKISRGNPQNGMPAWEGALSPSERRAIVHYLREEFIQTDGR